MNDEVAAFFVYGTLKRGESNHSIIAPYCRAIFPAVAHGTLYDCGPWPALIEGENPVQGELIEVDRTSLARVLSMLDALEGYDPTYEEASPYVRRVITCATDDGATRRAHVYFYRGSTDAFRLLPAGHWPPDSHHP